ncbi:hypothetical protein NM208_g4996 [Fusarium decemcellulare]|uniref:Uncharacterized protein n=1 Tax=Fusarium decemcellulare TaxID=57161 RepID=A0ACC1SIR1_9HYPO|nr:hypothetical protein NM208_g4996 [Fusarium decemcellulare]
MADDDSRCIVAAQVVADEEIAGDSGLVLGLEGDGLDGHDVASVEVVGSIRQVLCCCRHCVREGHQTKCDDVAFHLHDVDVVCQLFESGTSTGLEDNLTFAKTTAGNLWLIPSPLIVLISHINLTEAGDVKIVEVQPSIFLSFFALPSVRHSPKVLPLWNVWYVIMEQPEKVPAAAFSRLASWARNRASPLCDASTTWQRYRHLQISGFGFPADLVALRTG